MNSNALSDSLIKGNSQSPELKQVKQGGPDHPELGQHQPYLSYF